MANVRGVILNGARYESEDTEARTLANQAISQADVLNNSVTTLESGFTNLNEVVAGVNQKATAAETLANQANTLANQANTLANDAYQLAEKGQSNVHSYNSLRTVGVGKSWTLSDANIQEIFGDTTVAGEEAKRYLLYCLSQNATGKAIIDIAVIAFFSSGPVIYTNKFLTLDLQITDNKIIISNYTDEGVTVAPFTIKV